MKIKKLLSLVMSMALVLSVVILPTTVSATAVPAGSTDDYSWGTSEDVSVATASIEYFRPKQLSNGDIVAVYYASGSGIYFRRSTDGGKTFTGTKTIARNIYDGNTEDKPNAEPSATTLADPNYRGRLEVQNPNIVEFANGNLMVTYRKNTFVTDPEGKPWNVYYTSICYKMSTDGGKTWGDEKIVREASNSDLSSSVGRTGSYPGFWEPDPIIIDGELFVYYASTYDTYNPSEKNILTQKIMYATYDETNDTFTSTSENVAQNGMEHVNSSGIGSRDGMPVVTELNDGNYAMVFESNDTDVGNNTASNTRYVVRMSFSKDGKTWTYPVVVAAPVNTGVVTADGSATPHTAVCASPYVTTLPNGRVAIGYQTSDGYTGGAQDAIRYRVRSEIAISNEPIGYDDTATDANDDWTGKFTKIANGPETAQPCSRGVTLIPGETLTAYYTVFDSSNANAGTKRNVLEIPDYAVNDNPLNAYQFNTSGSQTIKNVTQDATGAITFPNNVTSLLRTGYYGEATMQKHDVSQIVDGQNVAVNMYSADTYTKFQNKTGAESVLTFDATNKTITTGNTQSRNWVSKTDYMQGFYAESNIKGNSKGVIYAGYAFHVDESTFTNETFNFNNYSGYTVLVLRKSASLADATVTVRYNTTGKTAAVGGDKNTIISNFFDAADLTAEANLAVWADTKNFYVELKSEDGTKSSGVLTYPLNAAGTKFDFAGATGYYPQGGFALISNGINTYSNFKLSHATYLEKAQDLEASATFTFGAKASHAGLAFGVTKPVSGGHSSLLNTGAYPYYGSVLFLDHNANAGTVRLVYRKYDAKADTGMLDAASAKALIASTDLVGADLVFGTDPAAATVQMSIRIVDGQLTGTLTNVVTNVTKTFEYDITSTYEYGGYGIYKQSASSNIGSASNISFKELNAVENLSALNADNFDVYQVADNTDTFSGNEFVSTDGTKKKLVYKVDGTPLLVNDFDASATYRISENGNLNAGMLFRADNIADGADDLQGYAVVANKAASGGNESRIVLIVYKYSYNTSGALKLVGEVGRLVDTTTLASVVEGAADDKAASGGTAVKLNLSVVGTKATVSFNVYDNKNAIAATSASKEIDLAKSDYTSTSFTDEVKSTVFNVGNIGLFIASECQALALNVTAPQTVTSTGVSDYTFYSSGSKDDFEALHRDKVNGNFYPENVSSKPDRLYQAVLNNSADTSEFDVTATFKSAAGTDEKDEYNMGYDFMINDHSGYAAGGSHATNGFDGYRVLFTNTTTTESPNRALVRLYKYTYNEGAAGTTEDRKYVATEIARAQNADFFTEGTFTGVEILFAATLKDGVLTATFTRADDTSKVITLTYGTEEGTALTGTGSIGWYIKERGFIAPSVSYDISKTTIATETCTNGMVYATKNAGGAVMGETVRVSNIPTGTNKVKNVYYTLNGVQTTVEYSRDGYTFDMPYGAVSIGATFAEIAVGNVNKDDNNDINAADLICLRHDLLEVKAYDPAVADVNEDGTVDVRDLLSLKKLIAANTAN